MMSMSKPKMLLRVPEAAQTLSISRSQAYELIHRGLIPSIKLGDSIRVPYEALQAMVNNSLQNTKDNYATS